MADNGQIRHAAHKITHNLAPGDLLPLVEVVNTATDITLSDREFQQGRALLFVKDISGKVTYLFQVRPGFGGWLAFADCWRKKKKR
jgi:hypothetical protein